jgi:mRNA-degrading endonuclease HigB of HigAB toxin-antitoxin module
VPDARPIADKRLVVHIQGNRSRIVCDAQYADEAHNGIVRVHVIGSRAGYDKIDAASMTCRRADP